MSRDKNISIQYASQGGEEVSITMFMGTNSLARKKSKEARKRRGSNTRRQDSRGQDYNRRYERLVSQNSQDGSLSQSGGQYPCEHSLSRS